MPGREDWLFNAEYPMVRWLEANGYDVSYSTGVDTDRRGELIPNHKVFMSVGHDEYWSGEQRANVEAARDAGVHLAFFSGNEIFWKTRWENSMDGSNTPYRTLVCYKETWDNAANSIPPIPRPGPAPGAIRASARRPTAGGRRMRCPAPSADGMRRLCRRDHGPAATARCASGATRCSRPGTRQTATLAPAARWAKSGMTTRTTASARPAFSISPQPQAYLDGPSSFSITAALAAPAR